jgi:Spy/CpxP family protein refolding chaperone
MNSETKDKWQIRAIVLAVFLLGVLSGGLGWHVYESWTSASNKSWKQKKIDLIFNQLDLNDAQRTEVQKIIAETRESMQKLRDEQEPRVQEIRKRADEKLRGVLSDEQYKQFVQLRDKMRDNYK